MQPDGQDAAEVNRAATFTPYIEPCDNHGAAGLPAIEISGVQVYAYMDPDDGYLRVSLNFDTAEPPLRDETTDLTPVRIVVGDCIVFEADRYGREPTIVRERGNATA